jgi:crotonobetainyl-CoA:carnitine CoA-transferase CaiB-like acyl-CoA transferase
MTTKSSSDALSGVRVLEVGGGVAVSFAGRQLADFGADVIKVEAPSGDRVRQYPPFEHSADGARSSLLFSYLNWNKRSCVIDLDTVPGRGQFAGLARDGDIVLAAGRPSRLHGWGITEAALHACNPDIVLTTVTNFGLTGPLAEWRASDLVVSAMSGTMAISGDQSRPPVKHGLRQALYGAGLTAAYAAVAGYLAVCRGRAAVAADVSVRDVVASEMLMSVAWLTAIGLVQDRHPATHDPLSGVPLRTGDGLLSLQYSLACPLSMYAKFFERPVLNEPRFASAELRVQHASELISILEGRLAERSARDWFEAGCADGLLLGLVQGASELLSCPQHAARQALTALPGPGPNRPLVPVRLSRLSRTPTRVRQPAPALGSTPAAPSPYRQRPARNVRRAARVTEPGPLLAGLKVLDLSNIVAGPYLASLLADLGATVIKIEAPTRFDPSRVAFGPFLDNDPGTEPWNRSMIFHGLNRGKNSAILDLSVEDGRAVLRDLVRWADVLVENYTPRVMPSWGMSYEQLQEINPRLIMLSNSGFGASGPWRNFKAQGTTLELTMGIARYTGYPDQEAAKAGQSYPDFIACWSGMLAVLAALVERESSGLGQWIDQSMYEVGLALMPEALLEVQTSDEGLGRLGPADLRARLSGLFPADNGHLVAVSVFSGTQEEALRRLCESAGIPIAGHGDGLRVALGQLVARGTADEIVQALQALAIPAGPVLDIAGVLAHDHASAQHLFEWVEIDDKRLMPQIGRPFTLSDSSAAGIQCRGPLFGEHNRAVLTGILGYSDEYVETLYAARVVSDRPRAEVRPRESDIMRMISQGVVRPINGSSASSVDDLLSERDSYIARAAAVGR